MGLRENPALKVRMWLLKIADNLFANQEDSLLKDAEEDKVR